jgi:hypothetical protein
MHLEMAKIFIDDSLNEVKVIDNERSFVIKEDIFYAILLKKSVRKAFYGF